MSRYYCDSKRTVEESTRLSIFKLKEFGLLYGCAAATLTWTHNVSDSESSIDIMVDTGDSYVKVNYTKTDRFTDKKTDYDYRLHLTSTPCPFGGRRYWFLCSHCSRRVGCLYLAGNGYFYCRKCNHLSYESCNESRLGRWGQIGHCFALEQRISELSEKLKRWHYAGRPTRKYRRVLKLEQQLGNINI